MRAKGTRFNYVEPTVKVEPSRKRKPMHALAHNTMRNEKTDCEREWITKSQVQIAPPYKRTQGDQLTQRQIKVTLIRFPLNR